MVAVMSAFGFARKRLRCGWATSAASARSLCVRPLAMMAERIRSGRPIIKKPPPPRCVTNLVRLKPLA